MIPRTIGIAVLALSMAGCTGDTSETTRTDSPATQNPGEVAGTAVPGDTDDRRPFGEIGPGDTVRFTGNEPFWGGEVTGASLTYSTPENQDGTTIQVEHFAGRGGISYGGQFDGAPFDMMITPGECSDGMSDRTYPYTVTLAVRGEQRRGCAWTDDKPRTVPPGYEP